MSGQSVIACGMTTAVGLTAPAACAALRARLDNFQETRFISHDGTWMTGAEVPLKDNWRGLARLAMLVKGPIEECLAAVPDIPSEEIPLYLCVAETARAGRLAGLDDVLIEWVMKALDCRFHPNSKTIAYGQVGGAVALQEAGKQDLASGGGYAIVAGVDSYLLAETLQAYDKVDRVLTEKNSDGFIPGEAGSAVLLGPRSDKPVLKLRGLGMAAEHARLGAGKPLKADGLVEAIKESLLEANLGFHDIDYRIADLSGEQYYFKEAALAQTRILRQRVAFMDMWQLADSFGFIGAAAIPAILGIALTAGRKAYAPGDTVMVHAAHDDGRRAAMILQMEK